MHNSSGSIEGQDVIMGGGPCVLRALGLKQAFPSTCLLRAGRVPTFLQ